MVANPIICRLVHVPTVVLHGLKPGNVNWLRDKNQRFWRFYEAFNFRWAYFDSFSWRVHLGVDCVRVCSEKPFWASLVHSSYYSFLLSLFFSDAPLPNKEGNSDEHILEEADQILTSSTPPPVLSMVELFNQRQQKLSQRKVKIAELSNSILENPEGSVSTVIRFCSKIIIQC